MNRTVPGTIAVVLLVLVAGCAGFGANGSASSTPTPSPTRTATPPPTPTAVTTPAADRYPDGWSETGIDDPDAALAELCRIHRSRLPLGRRV